MNNLTPAAIAHVTAQIRARYIGQRIYRPNNLHRWFPEWELTGAMCDAPYDGYLSLRGIERLTDEEVHKIWAMYGYTDWFVDEDIKGCRNSIYTDLKNGRFNFDVYFYLLSLGIALPQSVMLPDGEFVILTREEQIEFGIIKIR